MPDHAKKEQECHTAAIIVAAGSGSRFGGSIPKQYRRVAGRPLISHTVGRFAGHSGIGRVVVVIDPDHESHFANCLNGLPQDSMVIGGQNRQQSVRQGLEALATDPPDQVLIHDGARPAASDALISRVIDGLANAEAVIPVLPVSDTLITHQGSYMGQHVERASFRRVQTPQGFRFASILAAHRRFEDQAMTDDAGLMSLAGSAVQLVEGENRNIKVTHPEDEASVAQHLEVPREPRVGTGYDVHRLNPPSPQTASIRLGGIDIPFNRSLLGHSDADVALHVVTDAILGALSSGDIGSHFPPSDPQWRGADSAIFVDHVRQLAEQQGAKISHVDVTIICQEPRVGPYRAPMAQRIAELLQLDLGRVSVKATTTEGLGFTGRAEGIAAMASATLLVPAV